MPYSTGIHIHFHGRFLRSVPLLHNHRLVRNVCDLDSGKRFRPTKSNFPIFTILGMDGAGSIIHPSVCHPGWFTLSSNLLHGFLALLDYVSRGHEFAICPSSVVRPSSVVHPSSVVRRSSVRVAIMSEFNARISFKF